ncbi:MAG TPA: DUF2269 family protein [Actinomycetota bacterium]|nr:DUF2269 family protein [Actinomycetota bacterium]
MFDAYTILKWVHVSMAIIAVGFNASYAVWLSRAARAPDHQAYVLRGVKVLDDRFANPAYGVLLLTGLWMVAISPWEITTFWILTALILYAITVVLAAAIYTPTLRKQIATLESEGSTEAYRKLATRSRITGIVLGVIVVAIVFLMVTKPTL